MATLEQRGILTEQSPGFVSVDAPHNSVFSESQCHYLDADYGDFAERFATKVQAAQWLVEETTEIEACDIDDCEVCE